MPGFVYCILSTKWHNRTKLVYSDQKICSSLKAVFGQIDVIFSFNIPSNNLGKPQKKVIFLPPPPSA